MNAKQLSERMCKRIRDPRPIVKEELEVFEMLMSTSINWDAVARSMKIMEEGFKAITCCIDAMKLDKCFLGKEVDVAFVHSLPESVDSCGENGGFHTFCFEGPVFSQKIVYTLGEEKFVQIENGGFWYVDVEKVLGE